MDGRFTNLEFEDHEDDSSKVSKHGKTKENITSNFVSQAETEYRWGRFESALRLYTRALRDDRTVVPAWVGQVQMLVQLGEHHEARVWSDKALEIFHDNGELLSAKAQACVRMADTKSALACSDKALQTPGHSPWRWIVRGEILLAKKEKRSESCFEKAIAEKGSQLVRPSHHSQDLPVLP